MSTRTPRDAGCVVLTVQADDDSREMYAEFLRHHGCATVSVASADEALHTAPQADVIVTGIRLHGTIDGVTLIARLRRDPRTRDTPIIVLTACAFESDRARAFAAGCDVFLPKPCPPEELLREVLRLLLREVRGRPAKSDLSSPRVVAQRSKKRK